MSSEKLYLKQNIQAEPLVSHWYAWPHLISPATAAMNVAHSHLKIMSSYLAGPQIHRSAVKNPAMIGGPFIDLEGDRTRDIKALLEKTVKERDHMIELAHAIKTLNELLESEAKGQSLEPFYEKIPPPLAGYVELVYDLNNAPSIRFIEPLLYKSRYYRPSDQSVALSVIDGDYRPFVFSTPRLEDGERLHLNIPFADERIDELFRLKDVPGAFGEIKDRLGIEPSQEHEFSSFFTTAAPPKRPPYSGDGVSVTYFGHACLLIESRDVSILTDPAISYRYDSEVRRYTYADLPEKIDYVLLTHPHQDHVLIETLLQIRHKVGTVIVPRNGGGFLEDPSLKLVLRNIGFPRVIEIDEMETVEVEGGGITGVPFLGEHGDLNIRSKTSYLVELNGRSILCAADSANLDSALYRHIHEVIGDVDVLFLGMECDGAPLSWIYGQLLTKPLIRSADQSRRLAGSNFSRASGIVDTLRCKQVYVYAMGQEPWMTYVASIKYTDQSRPIVESDALVKYCRSKGVHSERLFCEKEILL